MAECSQDGPEYSKNLAPFGVVCPGGFRIISNQLVFPGAPLLGPHGAIVVFLVIGFGSFQIAFAQQRPRPFDDPQ